MLPPPGLSASASPLVAQHIQHQQQHGQQGSPHLGIPIAGGSLASSPNMPPVNWFQTSPPLQPLPPPGLTGMHNNSNNGSINMNPSSSSGLNQSAAAHVPLALQRGLSAGSAASASAHIASPHLSSTMHHHNHQQQNGNSMYNNNNNNNNNSNSNSAGGHNGVARGSAPPGLQPLHQHVSPVPVATQSPLSQIQSHAGLHSAPALTHQRSFGSAYSSSTHSSINNNNNSISSSGLNNNRDTAAGPSPLSAHSHIGKTYMRCTLAQQVTN